MASMHTESIAGLRPFPVRFFPCEVHNEDKLPDTVLPGLNRGTKTLGPFPPSSQKAALCRTVLNFAGAAGVIKPGIAESLLECFFSCYPQKTYKVFC